ncbi:hypothetical protein AZA_87378 [Nitrospirillum viridazoti Y2]|uniref:hypothetical protein n=1 Tax=Nitrospirillum viridazoti TaxID=3144925 RepID=UPI0002265DE2|nr:hypothetical protein [Nitrospirillum amazonense]EGX99753.1 hypothetical protein AZA_87378 [Nitrospirillum amazonense Y2]
MNALIASISHLGTAAPLPKSRAFVAAIAVAVAVFAVTYFMAISVTGNDSAAFKALGVIRYPILALLGLSVFIFLFSGIGLIFRCVFHRNGQRILRDYASTNGGMGGAPAFVEPVSRIEFADGMTVLAWGLMVLGVVISIVL